VWERGGGERERERENERKGRERKRERHLVLRYIEESLRDKPL